MALALPAPAMATSFSALFNDASTDPFLVQGSYDNYLSSFNIIAGVAPETPDAVRQGIAAAANQRLPVALLLLVDGLLRPYFLPFRRDQAVGVPPHPATDNKLFAFDGELIQGQGVVVEIPNQWFNLIPNTTVATSANIQGLLGGDVNLQLLGPFNAGDADTQEVRTRSVVAIPNKYVGLFLSQPEGVTPRYYFETILPFIEADGMGQTCTPLTRFCQVAITHSALNAVSTLQVEMPVAPPRHVPLLTQASTMLHHHLPALSAGHAGGGVNLQPLVNTIVAGQQQRQQEQDQVRADKLLKETTTVESWLGPENFRRLLKYCGVALEADLPPLWPALAKANAKDRLGIFQGKVANELLAMGAVYEKYIPNLYLLTEVTALRWTMVNPDALESGSMANAFLFTDSDVEAEQGISRQIGFVQSGGAAPSLADAHTLLKSKVNLPGPDDSIRALRRMQAVYRAVLPVGHPLTNFLGQHYDVMRAFDPSWHNYATHVPELRGLKGVFHLQWLSLKLTKYFTQHDHNFNVITCPDPTAIVDSIQEQRQWEPNLTDVFVSRYNVQAFINVHSRGTPSIVTASTAGLTSSASSVVSGLTATPSVAPSIGGQAAGGRSSGGGGSRSNSTGDRIENTHFNTALFGVYKTSTIKSKELRKKIERGELPPLPPSKANASKPVCLAWHTKGQCNSLCPHSADHTAYSAEEYAALETWCRDHGYASL